MRMNSNWIALTLCECRLKCVCEFKRLWNQNKQLNGIIKLRTDVGGRLLLYTLSSSMRRRSILFRKSSPFFGRRPLYMFILENNMRAFGIPNAKRSHQNVYLFIWAGKISVNWYASKRACVRVFVSARRLIRVNALSNRNKLNRVLIGIFVLFIFIRNWTAYIHSAHCTT